MKYNRTYHFPFSPGVSNDDRIAETLEHLIGREIVITEKLDGENNGMTKGGVYARSHAAYTISPWSLEVRILHSLIGKDIPEDVYIFGEGMAGIHSIEYTNLTSYFYIFGIREGTRWYSWEEIEEYAFLLDVPTVPVLFKGIVNSEKELKDLVESLSKENSSLGGPREGIVARVADEFDDEHFSVSVLKWVRKGHVQTDEHWSKNWKKAKLNDRR